MVQRRYLWVKGLPGLFTAGDLKNPKASSRVQSFCCRITDLGYNAVIFDGWNHESPLLFSYLQNQGLEVIVKPTIMIDDHHSGPCDRQFRQRVQEGVQAAVGDGVDGIFWESYCQHPRYHSSLEAREKLTAEVIGEEMALVEDAAGIPVVFYLPYADEEACLWLFKLCDDAVPQTTIAFSAVAGAPTEGYCPLHPYWADLRHRRYCSSTPLLPIVNAGQIAEGDGLWPIVPLDLFDQIRCRMNDLPFIGAIALTETLPRKGGLLDCSLWVFGQMLAQDRSADLLAEEWFAAHRPEENYVLIREKLAQARRLGVVAADMQSMVKEGRRSLKSSESLRTQAESMLAQTQQLLNEKSGGGHPSLAPLSDYFTCFARDVRCIVLAFLHHHHVPLPQTFTNDDLAPAFWTQVTSTKMSAVNSIPMITCLDEPFQGDIGSPMQQIFQENCELI